MKRDATSEPPLRIQSRTTLRLRRPPSPVQQRRRQGPPFPAQQRRRPGPLFPAQQRRRPGPLFPAQQRRRQSLKRQNPIPRRQKSILRCSRYVSSIIKRILHRNCETISPPRATASKLQTLIFQKSRKIIDKKLGRSE